MTMSRSPAAPLALALAVMLTAAAPAHAQNGAAPDEAGVRAALQHYLDAHATGDGVHIDSVFHPNAALYWVVDGELRTRPGQEYRAGFDGEPAEDEAQRRRWIEAVDVTGDVAVGKVILDYPGALLTDYFALLRVDGEWRVITKIFNRGPARR